MASQGTPTNPAGRRRLAIPIALCGGLAAIVVFLVAVPGAAGGGWDVLNSLRSSSSATPEPGPASEPASDLGAPAPQLLKACVKQVKGQEVAAFYVDEIPVDRWGDPVNGLLSTYSEPYVLWLFDADCKSYEAVAVPANSSRSFSAYLGQVFYYAEASAEQPVDDCACRVFSPSNSGVSQEFSDTGRLTFDTR